MSDKEDIHDALKAAGAPDYMVLIITKIMGAEDANREMLAALNTRTVELNQRERSLEGREQAVLDAARVITEREQAVVNAAKDMKEFASRLYGPDSELTKINQKLGAIESAGANRDQRYAERFRVIDENQTRLKDFVESKFREINDRFTVLEGRVLALEKAS